MGDGAMTRILFFGDIDATGFGSVTTDLGRALLDRGEDVRFLSQNAAGEALAEPFRSRTVTATSLITVIDQLAGTGGITGSANIIGDLLTGKSTAMLTNGTPYGAWVPEAAIMLGDFTAARMLVMPHWEAFREMRGRLFHYVPIEGIHLPPFWNELWSVLTPVAMSNFGADEIAKVTGSRPPMSYHGVDAEVFHPASSSRPLVIRPSGREPLELASKDECKRMWAAFFGVRTPRKWILRTDRHMPRKAYNAMLRGLVPHLYANPDTALILHCRQFDQGGYLPDTLSKLPGARPLTNGLADEDNPRPDAWALFGRPFPQVILTNQTGLPRDALASLYNAADLYVSTSAEGFGLTIAEALACGVPAVGVDFSAVPEVIGPAGSVVPIAGLLENMYDHFWCWIDEKALGDTVSDLMARPNRRERLGAKGPAHVKRNFSWSTAAEQFSDLISQAVGKELVA